MMISIKSIFFSKPIYYKRTFLQKFISTFNKILVGYHGGSVVQSNCELTQLGKIKDLGKNGA